MAEDEFFDKIASTASTEDNYDNYEDEESILIVNYARLLHPVHPNWLLIPVTIILVVLFIVGILGNLCACIVIKRVKSLHTTPNYYLFSLAVSDLLLISVSPVFALMLIWDMKSVVALLIVFIFIILITVSTSSLTLIAFTVERYVAICHPFYAHKMSSPKRALKLITFIWIFSTGFTIFRTFYSELAYVTGIWVNFVLCYFIPLILLVVLYTLIMIRIAQSKHIRKFSGRYSVNSNQRSTKNCKKATVTDENRQDSKTLNILVAIVIVFFVCWTPYHLLPLARLYTAIDREILDLFLHLIIIIYCFSACFNPIIYSIMSTNFRKGFKKTFFNAEDSQQTFSETGLEEI